MGWRGAWEDLRGNDSDVVTVRLWTEDVTVSCSRLIFWRLGCMLKLKCQNTDGANKMSALTISYHKLLLTNSPGLECMSSVLALSCEFASVSSF